MDHSMPDSSVNSSPQVSSNSCPLSQWCYLTISAAPFFCLQSFPASVFANESAFRISWPKYWSWSFSISPSNKYSGLISFRIDWFDLLAIQGTLKSLSPAPQFKSINSLALIKLDLLYGPVITSLHDYWKNIALAFVSKVMSLLFNMQCSLMGLISGLGRYPRKGNT